MADPARTPPRNRDLDQPRQTGETIEPATPPARDPAERNAPLPEEETYERDAPNRAPRSDI